MQWIAGIRMCIIQYIPIGLEIIEPNSNINDDIFIFHFILHVRRKFLRMMFIVIMSRRLHVRYLCPDIRSQDGGIKSCLVRCSHQSNAFIYYVMRTILNAEFHHILFIHLTGEIKFDKSSLRRTTISIEISTAGLKSICRHNWIVRIYIMGSVRINHLILDKVAIVECWILIFQIIEIILVILFKEGSTDRIECILTETMVKLEDNGIALIIIRSLTIRIIKIITIVGFGFCIIVNIINRKFHQGRNMPCEFSLPIIPFTPVHGNYRTISLSIGKDGF